MDRWGDRWGECRGRGLTARAGGAYSLNLGAGLYGGSGTPLAVFASQNADSINTVG